ncbi:MAG: beta-hexosaminidase [Boseongicola sp.]|nr:beta-hexosaminidase [Boseongicola sp.]
MPRGAYIFAPSGPELGRREADFFSEAEPFGFILFQRNCESPDQLLRLTGALREAVGRDAPILIDQEGGRVQRMRAPHWREWMPPLDQVEALVGHGCVPPEAERVMYLRGFLIGTELLAHGIDVNCAPCVDVARPETHPFLRNRCLGTTAPVVTVMARSLATGLTDSGCLPVLKHAPGHGRAIRDSHDALPCIEASLAELLETDFVPFRELADLPMVMTAHVVLPEIDPERPVTLSASGVTYLREKLGLSGLLLTDDISMGALSGKVEARAESAHEAGCDLVLHCNGDLSEMSAIASAVGGMSSSARRLADIAFSGRRDPLDVDICNFEAEFAALTQEAGKNAGR